MICHYRTLTGEVYPYDENTSDMLSNLTFTGLVEEVLLSHYPHRINFKTKTVYHTDTGQLFVLIYGRSTVTHPDGLPILTVEQLHEYARLC
jgi:hypothetical protein